MCRLILILVLATAQICMAETQAPTPRRDINVVLAEHDKALLAVKGVTGVYVALLDDHHPTPCLRVMIEQDSAAVRKQVPSSIEGYLVVVEVSGKIRPLGSASPDKNN
jgi:hypothetical protein